MPNARMATISTNDIYVNEDIDRVLTGVIEDLEDGKANTNHSHTPASIGAAPATHYHDYAATGHAHNINEINDLEDALAGKAASDHAHTGYAAESHTHDGYAAAGHTHTAAGIGAAAADHGHALADVDGLTDALAGKAASGHTHSQYASSTHTHTPAAIGAAASDHSHTAAQVGAAPATHTHTQYAASGHTHTAAQVGAAASSHTHSDYAPVNHAHSEYAGATHGHSTADVTGLEDALDGKASTSHTHTASEVGAATATHTHTASQVGAAASNHGHSYNDLSDKPSIPAAYSHPASHPASMITGLATVATSGKYADLDGKPTIPAAYSHPASHPASMITGLSTVATSGKYSDLTGLPTIPTIPGSLPADGGNADTVDGKHASDFAAASHTHAYAASGHNHDSDYVSKDVQITANSGDVKYSFTNKDVIAEITAMETGMHTAYAPNNGTNVPKAGGGSWRFLIHKVGVEHGWVQAFCMDGSLYIGVLSGGNWKGWRCLYDPTPAPLWTGGYLMTEGHTVTPTKKLSECRNGWLLMWSDYDPGVAVNNTDFYWSIVYKKAYSGQNWSGGEHYFDVPRYTAGSATDSESRIIKFLKVHDTKLVGTEHNAVAPRNDVVLRAVYEF